MQHISTKGMQNKHDWTKKVIYWELCKKLKFHHTNKWYIYIPEAVHENKMQKILRDFERWTDNPIPGRVPGLVLYDKKKRICHIVDFTVPADHKVKVKVKEGKNLDKYKGHLKKSKPFPDFRFFAHFSHLYWPHLHRN